MIHATLATTARWLGVMPAHIDAEYQGVSTDTRTLRPRNLFIALTGPHYNGHDFIERAFTIGASAALVSQAPSTAHAALQVSDTNQALGQLAAAWRQRFTLPVIAVTGSNGKTTVKEMIAAIASIAGPALVTAGNFNNNIGMPLTLLRLAPEHRHAVLEMGANHAGEIAALTAIARPDIALITNAGPAHLEGFGSIANVAHAKGEIFTGMSADGVAVINADDPHSALWHELAGARRVLSFGLDGSADISAAWTSQNSGTALHLRTPYGTRAIKLALPGRHNVINALAAAAAALAAGMDLASVGAGLEAVRAVNGRLQYRAGPYRAQIIDDTYNANPASLRAALQVLVDCATPRWLVLGDMAELGDDSVALHREAGLYARQCGIDRLFSIGTASLDAARMFGAPLDHYTAQEPLAKALLAELAAAAPARVTLLFKGSRSAHMERVIAALERASDPAALKDND